MSERDSVNISRQQALNQIGAEIEGITHTLSQTPDHHPNMPLLLIRLGASYNFRFHFVGDPADVDMAIEYMNMALTLTPKHHPTFHYIAGLLGNYYNQRFQRLREVNDSEQSIEYQSLAIALTPTGDSALPVMHASLGASYYDRFQSLGELHDLETALEHQTRAVELTRNGDPSLPTQLANLGQSYCIRFERLGGRADIEKAIECQSRAVALTPEGHPGLPHHLATLAASYNNRFENLGGLNDLETAIEYEFRVLTLTPDGHPDLPARLHRLGTSLKTRFELLGQVSDLEKAIAYQSRAITLTPDGHPAMPSLLDCLGVAVATRFKRLRELGDLDKAIECSSRALALAPDSHPHFPGYLHNLSSSYGDRYIHSRKIEDINKAIEYQSRALALTPNDHPDLSMRLYGLGSKHSRRFYHLRERKDNDKAIEYMTYALQPTSDGFTRLISDMFPYAITWASIASRHQSLGALEAYQTAIDLLPQFIWLGATATQRYDDLSEAETLAVDAAASSIKSHNYSLALEWLDHARCVVWSQSLMLRSPLDELHRSHPDIAARLREVATQLQHASSDTQPAPFRSIDLVDTEQPARKHRRFAQEYADLLAQARSLPGFDGLLQPMKANRLMGAARTGPIVVINCHKVHCDALVIFPGAQTIQHIPLPNFTSAKARSIMLAMEGSVRNSQQMERAVERQPVVEDTIEFESVVNTLWYGVVKPILDHLGYTVRTDTTCGASRLTPTSKNGIPDGNLPHITWCPTGPLSFLPLHAAGDYSQPRCRVFDYVISSYTPTLSALLSSTPSSLSSNSRVLAIAQPDTPGHSRLPGTLKEVECVMGHTSGKATCSHLIGDEATTTRVLDAMEHHDWVHLACHAHQNVTDPTKSGFFLHNGALDLASINQRSFQNKGLAYLSACQTATGDEKLPDEAIHLASGMLMAGYSSVIATMWSVMDDDAPFVADRFYSRVMKDGTLGNGEAGKALHYAVGELRDRVGEQEFRRWVPYIHIGS